MENSEDIRDRALRLSLTAVLNLRRPCCDILRQASQAAGTTPTRWVLPKVERMVRHERLTAPESKGLPRQHVQETLLGRALEATHRHN